MQWTLCRFSHCCCASLCALALSKANMTILLFWGKYNDNSREQSHYRRSLWCSCVAANVWQQCVAAIVWQQCSFGHMDCYCAEGSWARKRGGPTVLAMPAAALDSALGAGPPATPPSMPRLRCNLISQQLFLVLLHGNSSLSSCHRHRVAM